MITKLVRQRVLLFCLILCIAFLLSLRFLHAEYITDQIDPDDEENVYVMDGDEENLENDDENHEEDQEDSDLDYEDQETTMNQEMPFYY